MTRKDEAARTGTSASDLIEPQFDWQGKYPISAAYPHIRNPR